MRRRRGLSQEALADLAHIDRSYMSSIERGLRNISVLHIARIATALEVTVCDLLQPLADPASLGPNRPRAPQHPSTEWEPGQYLSLG